MSKLLEIKSLFSSGWNGRFRIDADLVGQPFWQEGDRPKDKSSISSGHVTRPGKHSKSGVLVTVHNIIKSGRR